MSDKLDEPTAVEDELTEAVETEDEATAQTGADPKPRAKGKTAPKARTTKARAGVKAADAAADAATPGEDAGAPGEDTGAPDVDDDDEPSGEGASGAGDQTALDNEGDIAADYLEELLDIVDLDGDIDTYTEGDRAHVSIVTESQTLVGKNGEVLDALQELARLAVLTETGRRSRLILDIGGHRDKRRKELLIMAQEAVTEVQSTGEPVHLPAMNPFERKIVHDAVAEAGLHSESEGVEPQRRVVVSAK